MFPFLDSHLGCDCPDGYIGPICEFQDLKITPVECNLDCMNQGICRKGAKDVSNLEKYGILNRNRQRSLQDDLGQQYNEDFEHCVCPIGYVGLQCEHQLDICPGGEYACLNGGDCLTSIVDGHVHNACDCNDAKSLDEVNPPHRYAGEFCEMESTQFCTVDGHIPLGGPASQAFCTNGGTCKGLVHISETYVNKSIQITTYLCEGLKEICYIGEVAFLGLFFDWFIPTNMYYLIVFSFLKTSWL